MLLSVTLSQQARSNLVGAHNSLLARNVALPLLHHVNVDLMPERLNMLPDPALLLDQHASLRYVKADVTYLQGPVAAMAGQIVVFCLVLGLCFGAGCGFLWLI